MDIIIPVIDNHELTHQCINRIERNAAGDVHIIIVDNNSDVSYNIPLYTDNYTVIRNDRNIGMIDSLHIGMQYSRYPYQLYMHNDVYIQEYGFDHRITDMFDSMPDVGLSGFFGAIGIGNDGGRIYPFSNMIGKEIGGHWSQHGSHSTGIMWSAVLDGLAMIFRKSAYDELGAPFPIYHHYYDKMIPLHYWLNGWKVTAIGIAHDHGSGMTSCRVGKYQEEAAQWCSDHNIPLLDTPDITVYKHSERMMFELYGPYFPAIVSCRGEFIPNATLRMLEVEWGLR